MINIALFNNKGGVGKSTVATHLAHGLAIAGNNVQLFGSDGQENEALFLGLLPEDIKYSFLDLLKGDKTLTEVAHPTRENLSVIFMPKDHVKQAEELIGMQARRDLFFSKKVFATDYNEGFRIFDCGPNKGPINDAILNYVDYILCPVQLQPASVSGIPNVYEYLEEIYIDVSKVRLIIPTMHNATTGMSPRALEKISQAFPSDMITEVIPQRTMIPNCQEEGITVYESTAPGHLELEDKFTNLVIKVVRELG